MKKKPKKTFMGFQYLAWSLMGTAYGIGVMGAHILNQFGFGDISWALYVLGLVCCVFFGGMQLAQDREVWE